MTYTTPLTAAGLTEPRDFGSRITFAEALKGSPQAWASFSELAGHAKRAAKALAELGESMARIDLS